ncbi:hypothetical protein EGW08_001423 [Elysia chlorotica]|uniref:Uncharacterized protein n=1 Tax=Elysia chlorotica TaxID=188477 RepID=A0A433UAE4_ELYCH|nr:hypothetical protein EGW08_001423 [Elysia chlorotica]
MSIWSRSHSDLARLAKTLKERNAQTRQGLVERGRSLTGQRRSLCEETKAKDDSCIPSASSSSSSPYSNPMGLTFPTEDSLQPSNDRLNLSDSCALVLSIVQRGRVDSFSSADSAISPDFHGGPHISLSPILKKSSSNNIRLGSNHLLIPGNVNAGSKILDKKVTFSLEDEERSTALHREGAEQGDIESGVRKGDYHNSSFVEKPNVDSSFVTKDVTFSQDLLCEQSAVVTKSQKQCNVTDCNVSAVTMDRATAITTERTELSNSLDKPQTRDSRTTDTILFQSSAQTSASHEHCLTKPQCLEEHEGAQHQDTLSSGIQLGSKGELRHNSTKPDALTHPNLDDNVKENNTSNMDLLTCSLHEKKDFLRLRSVRPNSLPNAIFNVQPDDTSEVHDSKTADTSLKVEKPGFSSVPSSPVSSKPGGKESSNPVSSLKLSGELNALLISVLANHKRQNLPHDESIPEIPDRDKTSAASSSATPESSDNAVAEKLLNTHSALDIEKYSSINGNAMSDSKVMSTPAECQNGLGLSNSAVIMDTGLAERSETDLAESNIVVDKMPNQFHESPAALEKTHNINVSKTSSGGTGSVYKSSQVDISHKFGNSDTHVPNVRLTTPETPFEYTVNTTEKICTHTIKRLPDLSTPMTSD